MRLLTYNMHGCVGRDGRDVPERVLRVISEINADVIALQEVNDDREGRYFLSELRKMDYASMIYAPTMVKSIGHCGNLLMTRSKSGRVEQHVISVGCLEPRGLIAATTAGVIGRVRIAATQLGLRMSERRQQWQQTFALSRPAAGENIAVLMGDFNEWLPFGSNLLRAERTALHASRLGTFPVHWPVFALDRIFVFGGTSRVKFTVPRVAHFR